MNHSKTIANSNFNSYSSSLSSSTDKRIKESSLKYCGGHPVLAV